MPWDRAGLCWDDGRRVLPGGLALGGGGKPGFGASRDQVLPQIGVMVNVLAGTGALPEGDSR